MITEPSQLSALVDTLSQATWTLAAINTMFESSLAEALRDPRTLDELAARVESLPRERIARCLEIAVAHGLVIADGSRFALAPGAQPFSHSPMRTGLLGEMRSTLMQSLAYVDAATQVTPSRGWYHTNPRLLQAQGDSSSMFAGALANGLASALDGLDQRLAAVNAQFLDIGVGVGALSIAMCRTFPNVRVVGLDTFDVPLAIARDNIARAQLSDRIELRQAAVEDLREENRYDLVWLPACFLTPSSMRAAIARACAALKPGGWLLSPAINVAATADSRRVASLILEQWGNVTTADELAQQYAEAGFTTRTMPGPSWVALVAGQHSR